MDPLEDVSIRPAERADVLAVFRIERAVFPQPWPFAAFENCLDAPAFLVAERDDGAILGYVVGDVMPNHGRDIGHVKDLAVAPDAQGRGLGRALLTRALARFAAAGVALTKLEVRDTNEAALGLYRDTGFEVMRRVPRYYQDGEDALVMVLDVPAWRERRRDQSGE